MTNKELAEQLESSHVRVWVQSGVNTWTKKTTDIVEEAARRLRELPDPTPPAKSDEQRMRELVQKHPCLSELEPEPYYMATYKWWDADRKEYNIITTAKAMTVIRGIVKAKCDEQYRSAIAIWFPNNRASEGGKWFWSTDFMGSIQKCHEAPDELAAIDALLTAMNT